MKAITDNPSLQIDVLALDPMADWLKLRMPDLSESEDRLNLLIELKGKVTAAELAAGPAGLDAGLWEKAVFIPNMYVKAQPPWDASRFCTARVWPRFLEWLKTNAALQDMIRSVTICEPPIMQFGAGGLRQRDPRNLRNDTVVMAVIDFGMPLFNRGLVSPGGAESRIHSAWIQDGTPFSAPGKTKYHRKPPSAFASGAEWVPAGKFIPPISPAEENAAYLEADLFRPQDRRTYWTRGRATHGSMVVGLAANRARSGKALKQAANDGSDRPLILVQLPQATVADGSGHSLAAQLLDALRYIVDESAFLKSDGVQLPVVVTVAYGNNAGPHDGQSAIEKAMAEIVDIWDAAHIDVPFVIVTSAGNSYQEQLHASWTVDTLTKEPDIVWRIPPDDATPNILQIWMPPDFAGKFEVSLTAPGGQVLTVATGGRHFVTLSNGNHVLAQAQWFPQGRDRQSGHHRGMFQLLVGPTGRVPGVAGNAAAFAPPGAWIVSLKGSELSKEFEAHAWIQRDDYPLRRSWPARQSYFQHKDYTRFRPVSQPADGSGETLPLDRRGSLNAIATGAGTIVVGAGIERSDAVALYSGGGFDATSALYFQGVDVVVPSDESPLRRGRIVMGMRSGSALRKFGTSLAAPMAADYIADNIQMFIAAAAPLPEGDKVTNKDKIKGLLKNPEIVSDPRKGSGQLY